VHNICKLSVIDSSLAQLRCVCNYWITFRFYIDTRALTTALSFMHHLLISLLSFQDILWGESCSFPICFGPW